MKFTIATTAFLLVSTVTAAPFTERRRMAQMLRTQLRAAGLSRTGLPLAVNYSTLTERVQLDQSKHAQYDSNWAGAVQVSSGVTEVVGTANFPDFSVPPGGSSGTEYGGSAWVGIDGDTCQSAILQTGIDWTIQNGQKTYEAWYEWLPEYSYTFDITVNSGDQIKMQVVANTNTSGTAYITNVSTGQQVSHTFSGETALCETNAEWIVEDFETTDSSGNAALIPFAQFSPVTFNGASFKHGDSVSGVSGASILDIQQNGKTLTNCSTPGPNQLTCTYTG